MTAATIIQFEHFVADLQVTSHQYEPEAAGSTQFLRQSRLTRGTLASVLLLQACSALLPQSALPHHVAVAGSGEVVSGCSEETARTPALQNSAHGAAKTLGQVTLHTTK